MAKSAKSAKSAKEIDADKEEALQLVLEIEQFNRERQEEVARAAIAYYKEPILDFVGAYDAEMAIVPEFLRKIAAAWPSMQLVLQICTEYDDVYGHQHVKTVLTAVPVWNPPKPDPDRGAGNMRVFKMELEKIKYSIPEPAVFRAHVAAAWEAHREVAKLRKKVEELESSLRTTDHSKFFRFAPPFSGWR